MPKEGAQQFCLQASLSVCKQVCLSVCKQVCLYKQVWLQAGLSVCKQIVSISEISAYKCTCFMKFNENLKLRSSVLCGDKYSDRMFDKECSAPKNMSPAPVVPC